MDVVIEMHAPGLDLHDTRWNYHFIFMKEVHDRFASVVHCAQDSHEHHGRGTVSISRDQWLDFLRDSMNDRELLFPCSYVQADEARSRFDFGRTSAGFRQILEEYDPERQLVLTVEHYLGKQLSCYMIDFRVNGQAEAS